MCAGFPDMAAFWSVLKPCRHLWNDRNAEPPVNGVLHPSAQPGLFVWRNLSGIWPRAGVGSLTDVKLGYCMYNTRVQRLSCINPPSKSFCSEPTPLPSPVPSWAL